MPAICEGQETVPDALELDFTVRGHAALGLQPGSSEKKQQALLPNHVSGSQEKDLEDRPASHSVAVQFREITQHWDPRQLHP